MSQQFLNEQHERELRRLEMSALFDGESEVDVARRAVRQVVGDDAMRAEWRTYALIGDHLRGDGSEAVNITASVMDRLREEPVVLAPRQIAGRKPHPFMALAASLAGVAVVGWLAWVDPSESIQPVERLAAVSPAPTFASAPQLARVQQVLPAPVQAEVDEYLLAHHMQAAGMRLGDGTERVRTITHVVGVTRP